MNGKNKSILDFDDPSVELGKQLTSDDLYMNGQYAVANLGKKPKIYAPIYWRPGSSISHWDEETFPAGDINSLMTPFFGSQESVHNVGPATKGLFRDIGWELNFEKTPLISLRQTVQPSGGKNCNDLSVPATSNIRVLPNTEVCYYYTVKNVGDITLNLHDLVDSQYGVILDDYSFKLPPGASTTVSAKETIGNAAVTNEAVWWAFNPNDENIVTATAFAQVEVFVPPVVSVEPPTLTEVLPINGNFVKKLTLKNDGKGDLDYKIVIRKNDITEESVIKASSIAVNDSISIKLSTEKNKEPSIDELTAGMEGELKKTNAQEGENLKIVEYYTDFENFQLGSLHGQQGWEAYGDGFSIVQDPSGKNKFLQVVSDGDRFGSVAYSPTVGIGSEPFSSFSATINIVGEGTSFLLIPQSTTTKKPVTGILFSSTGFIFIGWDQGFYNTYIPTPIGTFDLQLVVDRTTFKYSLSINGDMVVDQASGLAGDIEGVQIGCLNDNKGQKMNIDNFAIVDGDLNAPDWIALDPSVGKVDPNGSKSIDVFFDAKGLKEGSYFADLYITTNDPKNPNIIVPVSLQIGDNNSNSVFRLIDASTNQIIRLLKDGETINLRENKSPLNIQVVPMQPAVGSVEFTLNGKKIRTENTIPYAAFGDTNGDYNNWVPEPGKYELIAIPYSKPQAKGTQYPPQKITFQVTRKKVEDLRLKSVCTKNPYKIRKWKIINLNDFNMKVDWLLLGTNQSGSLTVMPGVTFLETESVKGKNAMVITWKNENGGIRQSALTSDGIKCGEEPSIIAEVDAYPNPISEQLNVIVDGETGQGFNLFIVNQQTGKVYIQNSYTISEAGMPIELNTTGLPKGTHILRVESGQAKQSIRIVKE